MRRILVLSSVHPIGHPRFGNKLVKSLGKKGYDVEVWARDVGQLEVPGNVKLNLMTKVGKLSRLLDLPKMFLRAISGKFDLVVVVPPETVPVGLLIKLFGKKVLWDVEEDAYCSIKNSDWIPSPISTIVAKIYDFFERFASTVFDGITLAEESYQGRFHAARRVEVTHNYPPFPNNTEESCCHDESRWSLPGPRLIYVGTMTEPRGLLEAIQVVKRMETILPNITLDVCGDIPDFNYKSRVESLISEMAIPSRITLHGRVPFDDLNLFMQKAHFGLLPLYPTPNFIGSEPTKVFEYSLAGLPTIVGDIPAWKKVIDATGVGKVAKPLDEDEWVNAISDLWSLGPEVLKKHGKIVRDYIYENNLFWDEEAKKLIHLCEEIIAN